MRRVKPWWSANPEEQRAVAAARERLGKLGLLVRASDDDELRPYYVVDMKIHRVVEKGVRWQQLAWLYTD